MSEQEQIKAALRALGVGANYRSYRRTVEAIALAMEDEDRLSAVKREIYSVVGERSGCTWSAVERNIRTVVRRAWRCNPELLVQMAGYPMKEPPTAAGFLDLMANYVLRVSQRQAATV